MDQWVTAWVTWLEHEKGREPSTCKLYERTLEALERDMADARRPLKSLTAKDLLSWLHSKGGSPSSYGNRVAALRSFYRYLIEERGFRIEDPTAPLEVPKRALTERQPLRDLNAKLRVLNGLDKRVGRRVGESSDMAIFLAQTGIGISDACALSLKPPVPSKISITRRRRPDKFVELNAKARAALDRLGGRFGIGPRALQRRFEKAGFHPDQLRQWHRVNVAERGLREGEVESTLHSGSPWSESSGWQTDELVRLASGPPETTQIENDRPSTRVVADPYRAAQAEAGPEEQFWMELAGQLEGIVELIRKRFAA